MKGYRDWNPRQMSLLPQDPMDWLPPDHLVHLLLDIVEELDLSSIESVIQGKDHRGKRPFPPRMMVGLLLYGYSVRVFSSRKLERATYEDLGFRVLCGGNHPDHSTINSFRKTYLEQLSGLFVQVLRMCQESGLVKLGHIALDGTKIQANASKHKAMSYSVMKEKEEELNRQIAELLEKAESVDAQEDERYGEDKRGDELPAELQLKEKRREKLREARKALEAQAALAQAEHKRGLANKRAEKALQARADDRAAAEKKAARGEEIAQAAASRAVEKAEQRATNAEEKAAAARSEGDDRAQCCAASSATKALEEARRDLAKAAALQSPVTSGAAVDKLPEHRVAFDRYGNPEAKAQRNFTDPDSKIMKAGGGYVQGYNCQAAVDEGFQIVVAQGLTNQAPDQEHLRPMLNQVIDNVGVPERFTADAGYWSAANADHCEAQGVDAYISTSRKPADAEKGTDDADSRERMRDKLTGTEGRSIYRRRKAVVEPAFGQMKEARGFRRFLLRGIEQTRGEWGFLCTVHNLLKLIDHRRAIPQECGA